MQKKKMSFMDVLQMIGIVILAVVLVTVTMASHLALVVIIVSVTAMGVLLKKS